MIEDSPESKSNEARIEFERLVQHEIHRGNITPELGREALLDFMIAQEEGYYFGEAKDIDGTTIG